MLSFLTPWKYKVDIPSRMVVELYEMKNEIEFVPEIGEWVDITIPRGIKLVRKVHRVVPMNKSTFITMKIRRNYAYFKRQEDLVLFTLKWLK